MQAFYLLRRRTKKIRRAMGGKLKYRILFLSCFFGALMLLHILAMMVFEKISMGEAAWLTITTATTVGYGDISASSTAGRWSTFLLMYAGGIFVLAQLAGLIFEASQWQVTQRQHGKLALGVKNHLVIFGWREEYITRVVQEVRNSLSDLSEEEIVIVSPHLDILPDDLRDLDVHHVNGSFHEDITLEKANVDRAHRIVLIPDTDAADADFVTLDLIDRLRKRLPGVSLVVACSHPEMEQSARKLGADQTQTFSASYPDMLSRSILFPGAGEVIEELINQDGAEMIIVHLPMQCRVEEVIAHISNYAILLGLRDARGNYNVHPKLTDTINDHELIFLIDVTAYGSADAAEDALVNYLQPLADQRDIELFDEPKTLGIVGPANRVTKRYLRTLDRMLGDVAITHLCDDCWLEDTEVDAEVLAAQDAVVLLADNPRQPASDAKTFVTIELLRKELNYRGRLVVETVLADNHRRFAAVGATDTIRPVSRNLDILARCVLTGAEEVLDTLYSSYGNEELVCISQQIDVAWGEYVSSVYQIGLPVAFKKQGSFQVIPSSEIKPGKCEVFMLVSNSAHRDLRRLGKALKEVRTATLKSV